MILASAGKIADYTEKGWWGKKNLIEYFKEHVAGDPERTALVDPLNRMELTGTPGERITYQQLDKAVDAVATALLKAGIVKDSIIMVQLPNTWELAMLYLAIARTGGLISPVPMQWRLKDLEYVARLTGAAMFITVKDFKGFKHGEMGEELQTRVPGIKLLTLQDIREFAGGEADPEALGAVHISANDIFTLCWTSGTEAEPKGCPLSHNNWLFQCNMGIQAADIRKGDVQLTAGPLVNMASLGTTFIPWIILGGTYVLHHPFDPQLFIRQMIEEKVNYTLLVPAVANVIAKHPQVDKFNLSATRSITLGSAPPSLFTVQEFKRRWGIEIGNIWGQNEGTAIVSGPRDVPDMEKRVDHLPQFGKPGIKWAASVEGIETKVVDPDSGHVLKEAGAVGELAYKGPNIMPGYFKRPDLTEKAFDAEGYFYTGDLFQIKEGNFISFFDRKKDIIIRGGYNISAQEVENSLLGHPGIADVAAVGMPDEILGERTCVFVVPRQGAEIDLEELKTFMRGLGVSVYKLPERMEFIEAIPRNPVGKILKSVLREELKKR
ncbi:MAG: hypothetical protein JL50_07155 [Peptococcaceae bacterium BICA1-7]|nr:MAG: hypothetical protein JL50_07155 [Peptococcaceae bacterium BICA1-7]HBV99155.1 (2,3-dihydroxybenzoyl)adenylate synthase [Desulfotomaculum sp.]